MAICAGKSQVTGEVPTQRPVTRSFDVFFDLRLEKNGWANNGEAGYLRRHRAHYEVTVMLVEYLENNGWISRVQCTKRRDWQSFTDHRRELWLSLSVVH